MCEKEQKGFRTKIVRTIERKTEIKYQFYINRTYLLVSPV